MHCADEVHEGESIRRDVNGNVMEQRFVKSHSQLVQMEPVLIWSESVVDLAVRVCVQRE